VRKEVIHNNFPESTAEEAVLKAGKLCYGGKIDIVREGRYDTLLMEVGEPELGDSLSKKSGSLQSANQKGSAEFARGVFP